jgi:hypothetical protein
VRERESERETGFSWVKAGSIEDYWLLKLFSKFVKKEGKSLEMENIEKLLCEI